MIRDNENIKGYGKLLSAAILGLGVAIGGFFPGYYYYKAKVDSNYVTVKGLSEMDVKADLGVWKLRFSVVGNDLKQVEQQINQQTQTVNTFLLKQGFKQEEIDLGQIDVEDLMSNPYRSENAMNNRFILKRAVTIRTPEVEKIASSIPATNALIAQGIIFDTSSYDAVSYIFTGLNEIKPKMLEEATRNAKTAALEFAKNSGSKVGTIRKANQGVFSILPREQVAGADERQQINKTVRVVSTIDYWLE